MLNLRKKTTALTCSFLMAFGLASNLIGMNQAKAATYRSSISGIMSRQYPRIMGNQFHSGNITSSLISRTSKILDLVVINKESDLFVDKGATVTFARQFKAANPNIKVLQYLNIMDVWNTAPSYTWMKNNGAFLYDDAGKVVHPYAKTYGTKRYAGNSTKANWQDYYAARAGSIAGQGMDGIFADNTFRSNAQGWKISSTRFTSIMKGWETMMKKSKSRMGSSKIFLGNSPAYGLYQARDIAMIEMRNAPNASAFKSYLSMSDQAKSYGQANIDAIQAVWNNSDFMHNYSSVLSFSLPACMLTDNIFAITNNSNLFSLVEKVGKVGYAKGARYRASYVLQRDFTNGKVVFNDTSSTRTVSVPSGLKTLSGTSVTKITLSPYRGVILKGSSSGSTSGGTVSSGTTSGGTTSSGSTTTSTSVPAAPTNLRMMGVMKGASTGAYYVQLNWDDKSSIESGFRVLQSYGSTSNYSVKTSTGVNISSATINLGKTPTKGTYYYKVQAYNSKGTSASSNTVSAKIQ